MGKKYYIKDIAKKLNIPKELILGFLKSKGLDLFSHTNPYVFGNYYILILEKYINPNNNSLIADDSDVEIFNLTEQKNVFVGYYAGSNYRSSRHIFFVANNNCKEIICLYYDGRIEDNTKKVGKGVIIFTNNSLEASQVVFIDDVPIYRSTKELKTIDNEIVITKKDSNFYVSLYQKGVFVETSEMDDLLILRGFLSDELQRKKRELNDLISNTFSALSQKQIEIEDKINNFSIDKFVESLSFRKCNQYYVKEYRYSHRDMGYAVYKREPAERYTRHIEIENTEEIDSYIKNNCFLGEVNYSRGLWIPVGIPRNISEIKNMSKKSNDTEESDNTKIINEICRLFDSAIVPEHMKSSVNLHPEYCDYNFILNENQSQGIKTLIKKHYSKEKHFECLIEEYKNEFIQTILNKISYIYLIMSKMSLSDNPLIIALERVVDQYLLRSSEYSSLKRKRMQKMLGDSFYYKYNTIDFHILSEIDEIKNIANESRRISRKILRS